MIDVFFTLLTWFGCFMLGYNFANKRRDKREEYLLEMEERRRTFKFQEEKTK